MKKILVFASMFLFFVGTASTALVSAATPAKTSVIDQTSVNVTLPTNNVEANVSPRIAIAHLIMWRHKTNGTTYYLDVHYNSTIKSYYPTGTAHKDYFVYQYQIDSNAMYYGVDYLPQR